MIERINLIEREPFRFTYGKLILVGGLIVFFCLFLLGIQKGRMFIYNSQIKVMQTKIAFLREQRSHLINQSPKQFGQGKNAELKRVFTLTPKWSALINDLGLRLPGAVWLKSMRGAVGPFGPAAPGNNQSVKKAKVQINQGLVLSGIARKPSDLGAFMANLKKSPFLSRIVLENSEKKAEGFAFVIQCDILTANF